MTAFGLPLVWLSLVLLLGSASFGPQQTQGWVFPVLKPLAPWATLGQLHALHAVVRKLAHLTEYGVLARLWLLAFLAGRRLGLRPASWTALLVCAACAFLDEGHQAMLLERTGSARDVVLDALGALLVLMAMRVRREAAAAVAPVTAAPAEGRGGIAP
jgi:VanZ family protein